MQRIRELDGLRAICALLVVFNHLIYLRYQVPMEGYWLEALTYLVKAGGVPIFFVISGYLITSIHLKEFAQDGGIHLRRFYIKRFFRIIPPFYAYLVTVVILTGLGWIAHDNSKVLLAAVFLGNTDWMHGGGHDFVAHSWSLAVEEQYYIVFPLLLFIVLRARRVPVLIALLGFYLLSFASNKLASDLAEIVHPAFINLALLFPFRYIIIGVLMAFYDKQLTALIKPLSVIWFYLVTIGGVLMLSLLTDAGWLSHVKILLDPLLAGYVVLFLIVQREHFALLRTPPLQWLGHASYSIYLWQQLFTIHLSHYPAPYLHLPWPICVALTIGIAGLSYHFIETPSIHAGRRLLQRLKL